MSELVSRFYDCIYELLLHAEEPKYADLSKDFIMLPRCDNVAHIRNLVFKHSIPLTDDVLEKLAHLTKKGGYKFADLVCLTTMGLTNMVEELARQHGPYNSDQVGTEFTTDDVSTLNFLERKGYLGED